MKNPKTRIQYVLAGDDTTSPGYQRPPLDVTNANSTARNSEQAPFFHLPPELRNRIYELVLGHGTIHIDVRGKVFHLVCRASDSDERAYEISKDLDFMSPKMLESYDTRHAECMTMLSAMNLTWMQNQLKDVYHPGGLHWTKNLPEPDIIQSSLQLHRVCKQIHTEAALIPYAINTFAFADGGDFRSFAARCLSVKQRRAITCLQAHHWVQKPSPDVLLSLQRLRRVQIFMGRSPRAPDSEEAELYVGMKAEIVEVSVGYDLEDFCHVSKMERRKDRRKMAEKLEQQMTTNTADKRKAY